MEKVVTVEKIEFYQIIVRVRDSDIVYRRGIGETIWFRVFEEGFEVGVDNEGLEKSLQEHLKHEGDCNNSI